MNQKVIGWVQMLLALIGAIAPAAMSLSGQLSGKAAAVCGVIAVVLFGLSRAWAKAGDELKNPWDTREFWYGIVIAVATFASGLAGWVPAGWAAIGSTVEIMAVGIIAALPFLHMAAFGHTTNLAGLPPKDWPNATS